MENLEHKLKAPIEVKKIKYMADNIALNTKTIGSFVAIRPVAEEYENKTYLGILLGDLPYGINAKYNKEDYELVIRQNTNPAIYVLDLKKIIFGYESWWGLIKSEADLKKITDKDINNVWYVKALKHIGEELEKSQKETRVKTI